MRLLSLETALTEGNSLTLFDNDDVSFFPLENTYNLSKTLIPSVEQFLGNRNLNYSDLDGLVVTTGPGSFTGIRVGIAAAQGLALANGIPLLGISVFEALIAFLKAHWQSKNSYPDLPFLILVDSKRQDPYYLMINNKWESLSGPGTIDPENIVNYGFPPRLGLVGGAGLEHFTSLLTDLGITVLDIPIPMDLPLSYWGGQSAIAKDFLTLAPYTHPENCKPIYISPPKITNKND